ncbi:MAG: tetratricopeptide repeat protein [Bacteroidia bacterium]
MCKLFFKKYAILICTLFFINNIYSSDSYPDSLVKLIRVSKIDTVIAKANLYLCDYYLQKQTDKALVYGRNALVFSNKSKNNNLIANAYQNIGLCYSFKTITDTAAIYLDSAFVIYKKIKSYNGIGSTYLYIGENLSSTASWDKALQNFLLSVDNFQLAHNQNGVAKGYGKIAQVLINMNRFEEALSYVRKGLLITKATKYLNEEAKLYNLNGVAFDYLGSYDSALFYYNKALLINYKLNSTYDAAITLMNMGVIYLAQEKFKLSEESTLKALGLMIALDERGSVAACYVNLGEIYSNLNQYQKSIEFLDKGIEILKDLKRYDFLMEGLRIKSTVLKLNKDYEKALFVYEQYTQLKDSLFSSESNRNIAEMQTKFKSKEQEIEIKLQQAETTKQKSINNFIIGIVILMLFIAIFLVYAYRGKKKANALLHLQKLEIQRQKEKVDEAYAELHEKNKEILDSIYYARRIQRALLTSEKYIERNLNKLIKK